MSNPIKISASILCADFSRLGEEIRKCEAAGVDMIHVDVMDGHFVPNITIGQVIIQALRPLTKLPLEAHLMIESPWRFIDSFIGAGADIVSIHAECYGPRRSSCKEFDQYPKEVDTIEIPKIQRDIKQIKGHGKKAFLVVNPGTPLCFDGVLNDLDGVLMMSVNPGFAKQKFIPEVLGKVRQLRRKFSGDIAIDGGINKTTAVQAVEAGANILATASYFFGAERPAELVKELKRLK